MVVVLVISSRFLVLGNNVEVYLVIVDFVVVLVDYIVVIIYIGECFFSWFMGSCFKMFKEFVIIGRDLSEKRKDIKCW